MVSCSSAKIDVTGGDIWVCEGYFAVITTPVLLSSCNWYTLNQVLYETGQVYYILVLKIK